MAVFKVKFDTTTRGLPTLCRYRIFTIDRSIRENWDYNDLDRYMGMYELSVSPNVLAQYQNTDEGNILNEMNNLHSHFKVDNNKSERYERDNQYIKCDIDMAVLRLLKSLFVSTLVYNAAKKQLPEPEIITFEFDSDRKTVAVTDLKLFRPDDPYYQYAKNAASSLSVEAIGLDEYSLEKQGEIKNFYDGRIMSGWKKSSELPKNTAIADKAGVYMLYDQNSNLLYVGKAERLQERMLQHQKALNDPMQDFTHYRYSAINLEYIDFLYLIENAAIHDLAWLVDMPRSQTYKGNLCKLVSGLNISLNDTKLANRVDMQTKKQTKK